VGRKDQGYSFGNIDIFIRNVEDVWEENILSIRRRDSDYVCLVGVKNILSVFKVEL